MKKQNEPLLFIETVQTEIKPTSGQLVYDSRFPKQQTNNQQKQIKTKTKK